MPPARRVAGHARVPRRRDPAHPAPRPLRAVVRRAGRSGRRCRARCTARRRCCGTARRRGCCSRATSATSTAQAGRLGLQPRSTARRRCPTGGRWSVPPGEIAPADAARSSPRSASASSTTPTRRRRGRSTRRRRAAPADQGALRPDRPPQPRRRRRSMADRPFVDGPPARRRRRAGRGRARRRHWGLPPPVLLRVGMNGDLHRRRRRAARRTGRPPTGGGRSSWPTLLRRAGVRVPAPARPDAFADGELTVTAWERLELVDAEPDWRAVGRDGARGARPRPGERAGRLPAAARRRRSRGGIRRAARRRRRRRSTTRRRDGLDAAIERHRGWAGGADDVVCHGDVHPGNVVDDGRRPGAARLGPAVRRRRRRGTTPCCCAAPLGLAGPRGTTTSPPATAGRWPDDPTAEAIAELRLVAATLMRLRAGRADPAAMPEARRRLALWRGDPDAPLWTRRAECDPPGRWRAATCRWRVGRGCGRGVDLRLDDDELSACVACGLCLPHCPTFRVTGEEALSPRGRIDAMRACSGAAPPPTTSSCGSWRRACSAAGCEPACPSGVPFGHLMEGTREALADAHRTAPRWLRAGLRRARPPPRCCWPARRCWPSPSGCGSCPAGPGWPGCRCGAAARRAVGAPAPTPSGCTPAASWTPGCATPTARRRR